MFRARITHLERITAESKRSSSNLARSSLSREVFGSSKCMFRTEQILRDKFHSIRRRKKKGRRKGRRRRRRGRGGRRGIRKSYLRGNSSFVRDTSSTRYFASNTPWKSSSIRVPRETSITLVHSFRSLSSRRCVYSAYAYAHGAYLFRRGDLLALRSIARPSVRTRAFHSFNLSFCVCSNTKERTQLVTRYDTLSAQLIQNGNTETRASKVVTGRESPIASPSRHFSANLRLARHSSPSVPANSQARISFT